MRINEDDDRKLFKFTDSQQSQILNNDEPGYGLFSCEFSGSGNEVLVGTRVQSLEIHDLVRKTLTYRIRDAHDDDINSACFDSVDSQVIYSASDDALIKIWDRRTSSNRPQGVLIGHREGITHISSKGDGLHLISNGKDQCIKLWDIRKLKSVSYSEDFRRSHNYQMGFDYRMGNYPLKDYTKKLAADESLLTFRGHMVLGTLIRCYFSPMATTGQRFIYTGSADGKVFIYDTYTGMKVEELFESDEEEPIEESVCRDVSWHPYRPLIAATSFDCRVKQYQFS